jgi:hypothetical protein
MTRSRLSDSQKVPAPAPVQNGETSCGELLTKIRPRFSTEFSTKMLKTFVAAKTQTKKLQEEKPPFRRL